MRVDSQPDFKWLVVSYLTANVLYWREKGNKNKQKQTSCNLKVHLFTHKTFQQNLMICILQAFVIYLRK